MISVMHEGLLQGDLEYLISSTISIDEYNSKINSDAIVVTFYATDEPPAEELSYFIESGSYNIIDTEVSPSTDENGNYLIFVEFLRDNKFAMNLKNIIDELDNITNNKKWNFTYYRGNNKLIELTVQEINKHITLPNISKKENVEEETKIFQFLKNSILENININQNQIKMTRNNSSIIMEHVAIGDNTLLSYLFDYRNKAISLDNNSLLECKIIQNMLGSMWSVDKIENKFIIGHSNNNDIIILTNPHKKSC